MGAQRRTWHRDDEEELLVLIYILLHLLCSLKGKGPGALSVCVVIRLVTTHRQNYPPENPDS